MRLVPVQSKAQPQLAVLGELPAQNCRLEPPALTLSPGTVSQEPRSSAPSQLNPALLVPVGRTPVYHGPVLQSLCYMRVCHQVPEQWLHAAAGDLVPTLVPWSTLQLVKVWFLSQPIPELTTCCDDTCACEPPCEWREWRWHVGHKKQIYGTGGWFSISGNHFLMNYLFSAPIKISMGMLVSEQRILTAAHCIHNSKDYVKGAKKIKVGFLMTVQSTGNRMEQTRRLMMHWIQGPNSVSMDYNDTLLELCRPHHMKLMAALVAEEMAGKRINFSEFNSDWLGELVYSFCEVEDETVHLIYQHCDARPGASGSEVYGKVWDPVHKRERKVIRVFSGHHWLEPNVAVCLTALKFAQICYCIKWDSKSCLTE
ncbi:LOW QUALITY PROTEIN: serine protease 23-like [Leptosomus discolor]